MAKELKLYVRQDVGTGNPLVLLHGLFGDGTQWEKIVDILKSDYRVIVLDLMGHGKSPKPTADKDYSAHSQVIAMHNSLAAIGATKNITIVGYSMGGAVALGYAATFADTVEQLYLISTPFYLRPDQMVATRFAASIFVTQATTGLFKAVETALKKNQTARTAIRRGGDTKQFHKMVGAHDNSLDPDVVRNSINQLVRTFDFCGNLQKVTAPVTFYAGKKDPFIVQGQLRALKKFNPFMEVKRLSVIKVDHMLVQNLPKQIAGLITKNKQHSLYIGYDNGGKNPLVLLHGIESSSSYWEPVVPILAKDRRIIVIDLLGFGDSPKPQNIAYSLNDHVLWLEQTFDQLNLKTFELAGHSLGSLVALAYAAKHPKQISKLTLFSPVFVDRDTKSSNIIVDNLQYFYRFSDSGFLYNHAAHAIGETKLSELLPTIRTIQNSIENQQALELAKKAHNISTTIVFGTNDPLIDKDYLQIIAKQFDNKHIIPLHKKSHNFPLFSPKTTLDILGATADRATIIMPKKYPRSFLKHVVALAAPVLLIKSALYITGGLLLFTQFAAAVLTIGLTYFVIKKGYELIKGAFSLKNEGLAYIGYIILGGIGLLAGYGLFERPDMAKKISVFIICGTVLLIGLMRIIATVWAPTKQLRRAMLLSGLPMFILGLAAVVGGVISIYIIVYALAIALIFRGLQYGVFATGALIMAYIRGFK